MNEIKIGFPYPKNEPIREYLKGSEERQNIQKKLVDMSSEKVEIPIIIDGQEHKTGDLGKCVMPHNHQHILGTYHNAGEKEINLAIESSLDAWNSWSNTPLQDRSEIFLRMAELLQGEYRDTVNAATMLNMSKNIFQAEIDAACELIDLLNFNVWFAKDINDKHV